jgi:hypothetical protein
MKDFDLYKKHLRFKNEDVKKRIKINLKIMYLERLAFDAVEKYKLFQRTPFKYLTSKAFFKYVANEDIEEIIDSLR